MEEGDCDINVVDVKTHVCSNGHSGTNGKHHGNWSENVSVVNANQVNKALGNEMSFALFK